MKFKLTIILSLFFVTLGNAQASINSGGFSNNNLFFSVGELFVISTNENEISSGIIGSVSIIEFNALSIEEIEVNENSKLYPNPTSNTLFIETKNIDLQSIWIYDVNGRLITRKNIANNKVDISTLHAGIYFVKLNNNNTHTFKIIKK